MTPREAEDVRELLAELPAILDTRTVSNWLGVSERTIRRWIASGRLRALKTSSARGGRLRVPRRALMDFMAEMAL